MCNTLLAITAQMHTVFERHCGFYGAPRMHQEIRAADLKMGRHRIARLVLCSALKAKTKGIATAAPLESWLKDVGRGSSARYIL
jgi:hypothetical protein